MPTRPPSAVVLTPVSGLPEVRAGDDLVAMMVAALAAVGQTLVDGDLLVVSSKVVSKSLGLVAPAQDREDLVSSQSLRVVAERSTATGVTRVVQSVAGPVMAAAGVDASNTGPTDEVLLLPADPDAVAADLLLRLTSVSGVRLGVVLSDTAGRPWREGQTDFALGSAGVTVIQDLRGQVDADGRPMGVTVRAVVDEVAAAADLVKGKVDRVPVALIRGLGDLVAGVRQPEPDTGLSTELSTGQSSGQSTGGIPPPSARPTPPAPGAGSLVRVGQQDWFAAGHVEAVRAVLGVPPGSAAAEHVGIPSVLPETRGARVARAVRVADHGWEGAGQVTYDTGSAGTPDRVVVGTADRFVLGRATERLLVSLRAEGLTATLSPGSGPHDPGRADDRAGRTATVHVGQA